MKYTIILVGEFESIVTADEVAIGVSTDNHLAIMAVRRSTDEELAGFNQDYLNTMTKEEK
jgi:hypothetical protein